MSVPVCFRNLRRSIFSTLSLNYRLHTRNAPACRKLKVSKPLTLSTRAPGPNQRLTWIRFPVAWTDQSPAPDHALQTTPERTTAQLPADAADSASCNVHPDRHRPVNRWGRTPDAPG